MQTIAATIARSIREKTWLYIEYHNQNEHKITYFWISIFDIDPIKRKFMVHLFNQEYSYDTKEGSIYFDNIKKAEVIEGSYYKVPDELITKLQQQHDKFRFIEYTGINERILQYYLACYQQDRDAVVKKYNLVAGIDTDILYGKTHILTPKQYEEFVLNLQLYHKQKKDKYQQKIIKMAINVVSIKTNQGIYPIVYRDILLDIEHKCILAHEMNCYNLKPQNQENQRGTERMLRRYYDGDLQDFIHDFQHHQKQCLLQLQENLRQDEYLDENPYFFRLEQYIPINIEQEYQAIRTAYNEQQLCAPLKCFFGLNEKERKRKPKSIVIHDEQTNMDQLRSEFNAMVRNVVYVQGPPGTGKTRTIINILLSCLLNETTSLIVSNNNEAINNIYRKLTSYTWDHHVILLPVLRLGSNENIKKTLQLLHNYLNETIIPHNLSHLRSQIKQHKQTLKETSKCIEDMLHDYENQAELMEQIDSLHQVIHDIQNESTIDEVSKNLAINGIQAQLQHLHDLHEKIHDPTFSYPEVDEQVLMEYLYLTSLEHIAKLKTTKYNDIYTMLLNKNEEERFQSFRNYIGDETSLKHLLDIFPFIISTNISVTKLARPIPMFDLMIMDEASQCNNALALLPMARCKRAIFVGDQNQLQPVITLSGATNATLMKSYDIPDAYNYKDNSILSTLLNVDTLSKFILLREHFRCHDKIIQFANKKYYDNELKLCSKLQNIDALTLIDIHSEPTTKRNTSPTEVTVLLHELKNNRYHDIAVITPFRKQAELIDRELAIHHIDHVNVGTIHTFQGDEKDRIIICSGISANSQQGSFNWMKNNQQLLNVATTRAKENLTLICDVNKANALSNNENNDFMELVDYMKNDGNYDVAYKENETFTKKVKMFKYYNVKTEEAFLNTLLHIKSVYGQIRVKHKVFVKDIFDATADELLVFSNGEQSLFDFVIYDLQTHPLIALEITSAIHYNDQRMQYRNRKKKALCAQHNITLLTISSDYVRRYSFIKEAILDAITT